MASVLKYGARLVQLTSCRSYLGINVISCRVSMSPMSSKDNSDQQKEELELVSVVGIDNKPLGTMVLARANKLAMTKGLKLVRTQDGSMETRKTPVYMLVASGELQRHRISEKEKAKDGKVTSKSISLTTRITDHDLSIKTAAIKKWLLKGHNVQVAIVGATQTTPPEDLEKTFRALDSKIGQDGRVLQKREKGGTIRFNLQPQPQQEKPDN